MSTVKITDLPEIAALDPNEANTIFVVVDTDTDITGKITLSTLYANVNSYITANSNSANAAINTRITANVATLRGEITANAVSANSVIDTRITANVATLRGEITANAVSANSVINTNISANVSTLRGEITANIFTQNTFTQAAFNKANTLVPTSNGATSAYASKYLVEYNPVTQSVSYSSKPDASSPYITGYGSEIHVSPVALDNTGNGTIGDPVKTIAKALELAALAFETTGIGERKTIILHPGEYVENVTLDTQYIVLTTHESIGKNTSLSGTLTISKGCTVNGLKMTNLVISATSATGSVDIINCTVTTATTKTSSAYVNFRACDLSSSSLSITGAGTTLLVGGNYGTVTVNNASAGVLAKAVITMGPVTLTAGTMQISDTLVYAGTNTSNAITQSPGSVLTLNNSQTLIPDLSNVARNSFGGFYSILHSVYDKVNSTFTGTSLNAISYSQYINADIIYTPTVLPGSQTAFTINFATTSLIKANIAADCTITLSNYVAGKVVEVWILNTSGSNRTVTHGCSAENSTVNSTTVTLPATSSAYLRYFSISNDNANTFVAIQA